MNITNKQVDLLTASLTAALVALADGGVLSYAERELSSDCVDSDPSCEQLSVDLQPCLPLVFEPVDGVNLSRAEIVGFITLYNCEFKEVVGEDGKTKEMLLWHGDMSDVVINFGYHGCNVVWAIEKELPFMEIDALKNSDYWLGADDIGLTYEQDSKMSLSVINQAMAKISDPLKFINELVEVANRSQLG